jgi:transcriptional regulator with XRE-family HTH domain
MGSKIREARKRLGLKLLAVERRTGINVSTLSLIENGWRRPNAYQAEQIKKVLGPDAFAEDQQ